MNRRAFIAGLGSAAAWPLAALNEPQTLTRPPMMLGDMSAFPPKATTPIRI